MNAMAVGGRTMNIALWVLQVLLAAAFLAHGLLLLSPPPEIAAQMNAELPRWFWLFLGVAEVLAALGLTVPGITRVMPSLVPAAALGVVIVMISATIWHLVRAEYSSAAITAVLLAMAAFTAYARWRIAPIRARR
jgi:putative oxidoreductase